MTPKFQIQNLLTIKENQLTGPMSPLLFAKEMTSILGFKFNRLARLHLEDKQVFQIFEHGEGLTGHDILIIARQFKTDLWVSLWVDTGTGGIAVCSGYQTDRKIQLTPIYEKLHFAHKLTAEELKEIFNYVFDNPEVLKPKGGNEDLPPAA